MTDLTLESLAERVNRLERQNSRLKVSMLATLVAMLGALCLSCGGTGTERTVQARELVLCEGDQRTAARLGWDDGVTSLALFDAEGIPLAMLSLSDDGQPALHLSGAESKATASVFATSRGSGIELHDADGVRRASLEIVDDVPPTLTMWDARGKAIFSAP